MSLDIFVDKKLLHQLLIVDLDPLKWSNVKALQNAAALGTL